MATPVISEFGFCGYASAVSLATTCAPKIEASNGRSPFGEWQVAHWLSSGWNPPTCLVPVAKLTSSWHDPQAARVGLVIKNDACAAPLFWSWQTSQRRTSAGSTTVEKSLTESM